MSRLRLISGIVVALLLLGTVVSWSRSRQAMDIVTYRFGTMRAPGEDVQDPGYWTYTARSVELNHVLGNVRLMVSRYKSIGSTEADMEGWKKRAHWDGMSVPRKLLKEDGSNWKFRVESFTDWNVLGLGVSSASKQGTEVWTASVPHWMLCVVLGAMMWRLLVVPWWRWRRGRCPRCAYDLRGVVGDRCPECGWGAGEDRAPVREAEVGRSRAA